MRAPLPLDAKSRRCSSKLAQVLNVPIRLQFIEQDRQIECSLGVRRRGRGLARLEFAEFGYPVRVYWDARSACAHDRDGFERVLASLLSISRTGEAILDVIRSEA